MKNKKQSPLDRGVDLQLLEKEYNCKQCRQVKNGWNFNWYNDVSSNRGMRRKYICSDCSSLNDIVRRRGVPKYLEQYKNRKKKILLEGGDKALKLIFSNNLGGYRQTGKIDNVPVTIDADYLITLYHKQKGLCYYTGENMIHGTKKTQPNSMSVDRIDPKKGYIPENVVLCTYFVNTCKSSRTADEFYKFCNDVLTIKNKINLP